MTPKKGQERVYILDLIVAKPGRGEEVLNAYMDRYAPGARERGMTLEFTWVTPPVWLSDQPNMLFVAWSVEGAANWWAMSAAARRDQEVLDWWSDAADMIESRARHYLSDISSLQALANV